MDNFDIIKNKFIRNYPNNNEYSDRINRELNLIIKKILSIIYLEFVKY